MTTTNTARLTGDTFRFKELLKERGWQWNPAVRAWEKVGEWRDENHVVQVVRNLPGIRNRGEFAAQII